MLNNVIPSEITKPIKYYAREGADIAVKVSRPVLLTAGGTAKAITAAGLFGFAFGGLVALPGTVIVDLIKNKTVTDLSRIPRNVTLACGGSVVLGVVISVAVKLLIKGATYIETYRADEVYRELSARRNTVHNTLHEVETGIVKGLDKVTLSISRIGDVTIQGVRKVADIVCLVSTVILSIGSYLMRPAVAVGVLHFVAVHRPGANIYTSLNTAAAIPLAMLAINLISESSALISGTYSRILRAVNISETKDFLEDVVTYTTENLGYGHEV